MASKMTFEAIALLFLLTATFVVIPMSMVKVEAQSVETRFVQNDGSDLDDEIRYVTLNQQIDFPISVKYHNSDNVFIKMVTGPKEAIFSATESTVPLGPSELSKTKSFSWNPSKTITETNPLNFPIHIAATFQAVDASNQVVAGPITILFVVYKEKIPDPYISVDRTWYLPSDSVTVTLVDPRANKVIDPSITEQITVKAQRIGKTLTVTLKEVDINADPAALPGTFRGTFQLKPSLYSSGLQTFSPFSIAYTNADSPSISASTLPIIVSSIGVRLDKSVYSIGEEAQVIAYHPGLAASPQVDGVSDSGSSFNLSLQQKSSGVFGGKFKISDVPGQGTLVASPGETITINYLGWKMTANVIGPTDVNFDKTSYKLGEYPKIIVTDAAGNLDPFTVDTRTAIIKSSADAQGFTVRLVESGINSGIFNEQYRVALTSKSSDQISRLKVTPGSSLSVFYTPYGSNNAISKDATISEQVDTLPDQGYGSNQNPPLIAPDIGSMITKMSCSSYGGDIEKDGICDYWEAPRRSIMTITYVNSAGAISNNVFRNSCDPYCPSSSIKDVLVEIDYLNGIQPDVGVLTDIKSIFGGNSDGSGYSYRLHYVIDDNISIQGSDSRKLNTWKDPQDGSDPDPAGTLDSYSEIKSAYFGEDSTELLTTARGGAKWNVYHYVLYGQNVYQHHDPGSSGLAEIVGNDVLITLNAFPASADQIKGAFVHELGHNLGLYHGGGAIRAADGTLRWIADNRVNCKPNYPSPMSYAREFPSVINDMTNTAPYSRETFYPAELNLYNLAELNSLQTYLQQNNIRIAYGTPGLGVGAMGYATITPSPTTVNWDGDNNAPEPTVPNFGVVDIGIPGCDVNNEGMAANSNAGKITGFNDWRNLVLDFRFNEQGTFASGAGSIQTSGEQELTADTWQQILNLGVKQLSFGVSSIDEAEFEMVQDGSGNNTNSKGMLLDMIGGQPDSVAELVQARHIAQAIEKLKEIRTRVDGSVANSTNDWIGDQNISAPILNIVDNNIKVLSLELPQTADSFTLSGDYKDRKYVIAGESASITPYSYVFRVNPSKSIYDIKLNGNGDVKLMVPMDLMKQGTQLTAGATTLKIDGQVMNSSDWSIETDDNAFYAANVTFTLDNNASLEPGEPHTVEIIDETVVVPEFPAMALVLTATMAALMAFVMLSRRNNGILPAA